MKPCRTLLLLFALFCFASTLSVSAAPSEPTPPPQTAPAAGPDADWYRKGYAAYQAGDSAQALDCFRKAVALAPGNLFYVETLAQVLRNTGQFAQAEALLKEKAPAFPKMEDQKRLQTALADAYFHWAETLHAASHFEEALIHYQEAFVIDQTLRPKEAAFDLTRLGLTYLHLNQQDKAIDFYQQALPIQRVLHDRAGEAYTLSSLGAISQSLGQNDKALSFYQQALPIQREVKDRRGEASILSNLGQVYDSLSQYDKAIDFYQQALPIRREIKDRSGEAYTLSSLGSVYQLLGQNDKAIGFYQQALVIQREIQDQAGEAVTLNNLRLAYDSLGQSDKSVGFYQQALALQRAAKDRRGEAITLGSLGWTYEGLGQHDKAIDFYQQALTIQREIKDRAGEAYTLCNLGQAYDGLKQYDKAIDFYQQALPIRREVKDHRGEAYTLNSLGLASGDLGQYDKAIEFYQQALAIEQEVKDRAGEAGILTNLGEAWRHLNKNRLAIFYGKQAVNVYQSIRAGLARLDTQTQKSYLDAHGAVYRQLADLLIAEGRLPEAQQILGMLKKEEYFDFVRRDAKEAAATSAAADLTPTEADWEKRYQQISDQIVTLAQEDAALTALPTRTPAQEQRLAALDTTLQAAQHHFKQFLQDLAKQFDDKQAARDKIADIKETQAMMQDLRELGPGTVMLYTLVGKDNFSIILMTPDARKAAQADPPISAAELNRKALAFRDALQDPRQDPRPLAQDLYNIIIRPIEKDLTQAGAKTLMWSLDGCLRYLPVSALYDGKHYLVERYRSTLFTPASLAHLKDAPQTVWTGLGMGVSQAHVYKDPASQQELDFPALPAVPAELNGIIQDPANTASRGILPGKVLLDPAFTRATMRSALRSRSPVVHIASHFQFHAGDDEQSFLLLGDGTPLSLAQIEDETNLFEGVDLLTLSACNTGIGDTGADGREVDGLGILAQRQGAKAIVATLWPVADESTRLLMDQFYQLRKANPSLSKAEAMQQAQLALLNGAVKPSNPAVLLLNPRASYAHPYYWAPFILIGNWK